MAFKAGQLDDVELMVNNQFKTFSINLNAQHMNGVTRFNENVRLLDRVEFNCCRLIVENTAE